MKNRRTLAALVLLVALAPARSPGQAPQQSAQPPRQYDFRERYEILTERNIFLRNRARPTVRTATTGPSTGSSASSRRPEQSYVLTGIVLEEGRRIAFIENGTTGVTERLAIGATIARGRITDIDFHHLEFETTSGQRVKVEIGKTLAGDARSATSSSTASTRPSESSAPIDPSNPNLTLEERLKLRRQQELRR